MKFHRLKGLENQSIPLEECENPGVEMVYELSEISKEWHLSDILETNWWSVFERADCFIFNFEHDNEWYLLELDEEDYKEKI